VVAEPLRGGQAVVEVNRQNIPEGRHLTAI
jgi:hypothetical protein